MSGFNGAKDFGFLAGGGSGGGGGFVSGAYGRFYSTLLQTASVINTPYALSFNNIGITNNFTLANDTLGNPTRITADVSGTYNIVVSIQVHKTAGGGASTLDTWFRLNSTTSAGDVANSDRVITLANNGDLLLLTYNFMIGMTVGQYIQAMWSTNNTSMHLDPTSANLSVPHPAGSSVILTINQV
jgi:hypothetical protein